MSHVKNVESYSRLVDICTGYGGNFNPGRQSLQLKAMRALLSEAQSSLQDVSQKRNALSGITNERARAYSDLRKLVYRIIGTLKASQASKETMANVRYYTRLINGDLKAGNRLPVLSEDKEADPLIARAATQQSYVARAHNFMRLAQLIGEVPSYETAAADLQPPALLAFAERLKALNEEKSKAKVALSNARIHRNSRLYKGAGSLHSNAAAVKSYLRVQFGSRSQEAAQLSELSFTKPNIR